MSVKSSVSIDVPLRYDSETIFFYDKEDGYFEFSNFYPRSVKIDGAYWATSEHYYQAQKFIKQSDKHLIKETLSPAEAFQLGNNLSAERVSNWNAIRVNVMRTALHEKFTQHDDLRKLLIESGDRVIIERSGTDYFWGIGATGTGENMLGKLLTELRQKLRKVEEAKQRAQTKWTWIQKDVNVPTAYGNLKFNICMDHNGQEHLAIVAGNIYSGEPVLTRIHSECMTGDVFRSEKCDCGPQLDIALREIMKEAEKGLGGILLYMRDEGRGIGLGNKLRAYKFQEEGFDTIEANEILNLPVDARSYQLPAFLLKDLGVTSVKLITNNPLKINGLKNEGIEVCRHTISSPLNKHNEGYLSVKNEKMGHDIHTLIVKPVLECP